MADSDDSDDFAYIGPAGGNGPGIVGSGFAGIGFGRTVSVRRSKNQNS